MKAKIGIISVALLILSGCAFFGGEKIFTPPSAIRYRLVSDCYLVRNTSLKQSCEVVCDTMVICFPCIDCHAMSQMLRLVNNLDDIQSSASCLGGENVSVVGIKIGDSFEMGRFRIPIVTISAACDGCSRITGAQIADLSTGEIRPEVAIRTP